MKKLCFIFSFVSCISTQGMEEVAVMMGGSFGPPKMEHFFPFDYVKDESCSWASKKESPVGPYLPDLKAPDISSNSSPSTSSSSSPDSSDEKERTLLSLSEVNKKNSSLGSNGVLHSNLNSKVPDSSIESSSRSQSENGEGSLNLSPPENGEPQENSLVSSKLIPKKFPYEAGNNGFPLGSKGGSFLRERDPNSKVPLLSLRSLSSSQHKNGSMSPGEKGETRENSPVSSKLVSNNFPHVTGNESSPLSSPLRQRRPSFSTERWSEIINQSPNENDKSKINIILTPPTNAKMRSGSLTYIPSPTSSPRRQKHPPFVQQVDSEKDVGRDVKPLSTNNEESHGTIGTTSPPSAKKTKVIPLDLISIQRNSPTSSPGRERQSPQAFPVSSERDTVRDITPRRSNSLSRDNTPRDGFTGIFNVMRDLLASLTDSDQLNSDYINQEITNELVSMRNCDHTTLHGDLRMLRLIFSTLINEDEANEKGESRNEKAASQYFEKWYEDLQSKGEAACSCESMVDQFWGMNISVVLKEYSNHLRDKALFCISQSETFLAVFCPDLTKKRDFFKRSGETILLLGARGFQCYNMFGATCFLQADLLEQSLDCLSKVKGDEELEDKAQEFISTLVSRPDFSIPNYKQFLPYLENYYGFLLENDPLRIKISSELEKFYYESKNFQPVSTRDLRRLEERIKLLSNDASLSNKEKEMIAAKEYQLLAEQETDQKKRIHYYSLAAQSFFKAEAYIECMRLIGQPDIQDAWAKVKFKEVQEHVYKIQRYKWGLSFLVTRMLEHAMLSKEDVDDIKNPLDKQIKFNRIRVWFGEIIGPSNTPEWFMKKFDSEENTDCIQKWFQKIMGSNTLDWLKGKKTRLFGVIMEAPEHGDPLILSVTESEYFSWVHTLLEIED